MTDADDARPALDRDRLALLGGGPVVEVVDTAPSTNAIVVERAIAGAPHGLVVVAEHQTAGRGRLDRSWETPDRAALTFSVLLRPSAPATEWPWLPLLAGCATAAALREAEIPAELKWPNDVLIGDGKVGGILMERVDTASGPAAVVGIGVNVSTTRDELPVETATSVLVATGSVPDRTLLLVGILGSLFTQYDAWQAGSDDLRSAYTRACATLGREVRVGLPGGDEVTGLATEIDHEGRLVVSGTPVAAGDVIHVRRVG